MSIKRMLLLASMALAAIAFAAPAAQGEVFLEDSEGVLEEGAQFTATSTNLQTHTVTGNTGTCAQLTLHLEVLVNDGTHVVFDDTQPATTVGCSIDLAAGPVLPVTFKDWTLEEPLTIDTWGHGETPATFMSQPFLDLAHTQPAAAPCDYTGNFTVQAASGDVLNLPGSTFTAPGCANGTMTGSFKMETTPSNDPVVLNFVSTD